MSSFKLLKMFLQHPSCGIRFKIVLDDWTSSLVTVGKMTFE